MKIYIICADWRHQPTMIKDEILYIMTLYYTLGTWTGNGTPNYLEGNDPTGDIVERVDRTVPDGISQYLLANGTGAGRTECVLIRTNELDFTGAEVYATFLFSNGTTNDSFGYFVYDLNDGLDVPSRLVTGVWTPYAYAARNNVDVNGKSIFKKTIVFPRARSLADAYVNTYYPLASGGQIELGDKVKLLYDTSDPTKLFPNNTGIGFFIVPDGWDGVNDVVDESIEAIHTYKNFNGPSGGFRSSLFFADRDGSSDVWGRYVIAFENNYPTSEDCCDVVVAITVNPVRSVVRYSTDLILNRNETPANTNILFNNTGAFIRLTDSRVDNLRGTGYVDPLNVEIQIDPATSLEATQLHTLVQDMVGRNGQTYTGTSSRVKILFNMNQDDLQRQLYFFDILPNLRKKSILNSNITAWDDFATRMDQISITGTLNLKIDSAGFSTYNETCSGPVNYVNPLYDPLSYICYGCWDVNYIPTYLDSISDVDGTLLRILTQLPTTGSVPVDQPYYITNQGERNIVIQSSDPGFTGADVYVTALYSAVYDPIISFGYIVYPLNGGYTVPTKFDGINWIPMTTLEIQELDGSNNFILPHVVVFPKAETDSTYWTVQLNSYPTTMTPTGALEPGSRVKLIYDLNNPSNPFPNNQGIMFFLYVQTQNLIFYTGVEYPNLDSLKSLLFYDKLNSTETDGRYIVSFINLYGSYSFFFNNYLVQVTPRSAFNVDLNPILIDTTFPNDDTVLTDTKSHSAYFKKSTITDVINSSICSAIKIKDTIQSTDPTYLSNLESVLNAMTLPPGVQVVPSSGQITLELTADKNNLQSSMSFINALGNTTIPSPIDPTKNCWDSFQDIYVRQKNEITNESLTVDVCDDTNPGNFNNRLDTPVAPAFRTSETLPSGIPNQYYVGFLRYIDNGETTINVDLNFHPTDISNSNPTIIRYAAIKHHGKHVVVDMLAPGNYYLWISNVLIPTVPDPLTFTLLLPQDIPLVSASRVALFDSLIGPGTYVLRYISVLSLEYNVLYFELLYAPTWTDVINQVNILADSVAVTNKYVAQTVKKRALVILDLLS